LFLVFISSFITVLLVHLFEKNRLNNIFNGVYFKKDTLAVAVHTPNMQKEELFEEHPSGRIRKQYNNKGFISVATTADVKTPGTRRILFTGDSHTDGVVWIEENFCTLLQDTLNQKQNVAEILNAGCGFYSFINYKGVLERYLYLKPDEFVIMVYTGNDFIESLFYNYRWYNPVQSLRQFRARLGWRYQYPLMYNSQSLAQVLYFHLYPSQQKEALDYAEQILKEIQTICQLNKIRLKVVLIPSAFDVDPSYQSKIQQAYSFSDKELNVNRRLTIELMQICKSASINAIDLFEFMQNGKHLYYPKDQHLNVEGNKALAHLLFPFILQ
jgi:lysophospholipase L1-like esterase